MLEFRNYNFDFQLKLKSSKWKRQQVAVTITVTSTNGWILISFNLSINLHIVGLKQQAAKMATISLTLTHARQDGHRPDGTDKQTIEPLCCHEHIVLNGHVISTRQHTVAYSEYTERQHRMFSMFFCSRSPKGEFYSDITLINTSDSVQFPYPAVRVVSSPHLLNMSTPQIYVLCLIMGYYGYGSD